MNVLYGHARVLTIFAVMLSSIMILIDMTIANVALPQMMGALGATSDQITWVLTSYTMAEAIFIPLASYFLSVLGQRNLLLIAVTGFMVFSALCGQADTLTEMVICRVFQGAFGASVIPISQSILVQIFPKAERGKAMAIFSIAILVGPVLGPTLGGFITERWDWRWIFYINLPVGLICLALISKAIKVNEKQKQAINKLIVISMMIGICSLQFVLDKGNDNDWFSSKEIQVAFILALIGLSIWVWQSFKTKSSIAPLWILKDKNLLLSSLMMMMVSMSMFAVVTQQPLFIENLLNYPTDTTGYLMAPRGLTSAVFLILIMRLRLNADPRLLVFFGLIITCYSSYMMSWYSLDVDIFWLLIPSMIQGVGIGLIFSNLSNLAYVTLPANQAAEGASIYNLFRTIGSSIGISIGTTVQFRSAQEQWNSLGGGINIYNPELQLWLQQTGLSLQDPQTIAILQAELSKQSQMLAFVSTFQIVSIGFIISFPLIFFLKRP